METLRKLQGQLAFSKGDGFLCVLHSLIKELESRLEVNEPCFRLTSKNGFMFSEP